MKHFNKCIQAALGGGIFAAFIYLVTSQLELPAWVNPLIVGLAIGVLIFMLEKK